MTNQTNRWKRRSLFVMSGLLAVQSVPSEVFAMDSSSDKNKDTSDNSMEDTFFKEGLDSITIEQDPSLMEPTNEPTGEEAEGELLPEDMEVADPEPSLEEDLPPNAEEVIIIGEFPEGYISPTENMTPQELLNYWNQLDKEDYVGMADFIQSTMKVDNLSPNTANKNQLLNNIYDHLTHNVDGMLQSDLIVFLIDTAFVVGLERLDKEDYYIAWELVKDMPKGPLRDEYEGYLKEFKKAYQEHYKDFIQDVVGGDQNGGFPVIDWGAMPPDMFHPYYPPAYDDVLPPGEEPNYPEGEGPVIKPTPDTDNNGNPWTDESVEDAIKDLVGDNNLGNNWKVDVSYVIKNGKCYRVITITSDGKTIVNETLATGGAEGFCTPIYQGDDDLLQNYKPPTTGSNINTGKDWYQSEITYSGSKVLKKHRKPLASESDKNNVNPNGVHTLQYTLNQTEEDPHYYETDMVVGADGMITYQELKDVLFRLSVHSGGKAIDDEGRFLILLENQILVIEEETEKIPATYFDTLLEGFKAKVIVAKTQVGKK